MLKEWPCSDLDCIGFVTRFQYGLLLSTLSPSVHTDFLRTEC